MGSSPAQRAIDPTTGQGKYANLISAAGTTQPQDIPSGSFVPVNPITTPVAVPRVASTAPGTGTLPDPGMASAGRNGLASVLLSQSPFGRGGVIPYNERGGANRSGGHSSGQAGGGRSSSARGGGGGLY